MFDLIDAMIKWEKAYMNSTKFNRKVGDLNKHSNYNKEQFSRIIIISAFVSMIVSITTYNFCFFWGVDGLIDVFRYCIGAIVLLAVVVLLRLLSEEIQNFIFEFVNNFLLEI